MEKQIVITVELASRAAHLGLVPSLAGRTRAPFGIVNLFGAAPLDDPRPPGPGSPLR
ncbi:hypothetical protein EEW87_16700 [Janibacter melonis]|uniref:Uncharacterized protein n=1 Tax=Janibacter melonis TaxID=262209 RepID=A0A650GER6_9MICO|nr:hypothetical protein [Janibacter melonis]QGX08459.1 hypothetical protein EEW87_16700 [Janibacter melonis]